MANSSPTWFQTATSASFGNGHGPWRRKKRVSMWRGERQDCPTAIPELPAPRSREAPGLGPLVAWEGNQIQRATHGLSPTPSHLQGHQTQHRKVQKPFPGTEMVSLSPSGFPESPLLFLPSPFPESMFVSVDSQLRLLPVLGRTASHFACYSFLASATSRENESHSPGSV